MTAESYVGRVDPLLPETWTIRKVRRETRDTLTFCLDPGHPFDFAPGQFNMLGVFGVGEIPISIAGRGDDGLIEHTVRATGTVSMALCRLREKDRLMVRGPYGNGWPLEGLRGRDLVFVSGGLGLAPLRPALFTVLADCESFGRVHLLYGSRHPSRLLYFDEIKRLDKSNECDVRVAVGRAGDDWPFQVGIVTGLIGDLDVPRDAAALICSSEGMMLRMVEELVEAGIDPANIYLALERNMKCGLGQCGRCQLGPTFVCRDGPVYSYFDVEHLLCVEEL